MALGVESEIERAEPEIDLPVVNTDELAIGRGCGRGWHQLTFGY
jgi:hypothetical protein